LDFERDIFMQSRKVDTWFLGIVITLVAVGFLVFISASLGLLAREGAQFSAVVFNQFFFGLVLGSIGLIVASKLHYKILKKYSFFIFLASLIITALVFLPGLGFEYGGAKRWLSLGSLSFQPAEFLKLGFVIYLAAWFSVAADKVRAFKYGPLPLFVMVAVVGILLLQQPDMGTFVVIFATALALFVASGGRWKHIAVLVIIALLSLSALAVARPYVKERILTFLNPTADVQGAGYQIEQSLIAIGSGEVWGRGFGQSVQKFNFLPEPTSDSIFAVAGEEFGFIGAFFIVMLFVLFALRGFFIARRAPDQFGRLLVLGIVILIIGQAFVNIGSVLGVFPLTGLPLPFVSHGGTALLSNLIAVGIVLNISKYRKN